MAMLPTYAAHMLAYVLLAGPRAYRRALHGVAAQARIVDGHAAGQHLTAQGTGRPGGFRACRLAEHLLV